MSLADLASNLKPGDKGHATMHNDERQRINTLTRRTAGYVYASEFATLQAAANATGNNTLVIPPGTYAITETLSLACHVMAHPAAIVQWRGATNGTAIHLSAGASILRQKRIVLPQVVYGFPRDWTGGSVGVAIDGLFDCVIDIHTIADFAVGLWITDSTGNGTAFNRFNLGLLSNNAINLRIKAQHERGWCNQNMYLGGRLYIAGGEVVPGTRQICIERPTEQSYWPDENNFYSTDVEGLVAEYHLYTEGADSTFDALRYEGAPHTPPRIYLAKWAHGNVFRGGYNLDPAGVTMEPTTYNNIIQPRENALYLQSPNKSLWRISVKDDGTLTTTKA